MCRFSPVKLWLARFRARAPRPLLRCYRPILTLRSSRGRSRRGPSRFGRDRGAYAPVADAEHRQADPPGQAFCHAPSGECRKRAVLDERERVRSRIGLLRRMPDPRPILDREGRPPFSGEDRGGLGLREDHGYDPRHPGPGNVSRSQPA